MLRLSVKPGEYIKIGKDVKVCVTKVDGGRLLRLDIDAPKDMLVLRSELIEPELKTGV